MEAKRRKVICWNICSICNYNCSYCVQKKSKNSGFPKNGEIEKFIQVFSQIPGKWEIKISGGEPFVCPDFLGIIQRLKETGHKISLLTNFSAGIEEIKKFMEISGENLRTFSVSLHKEFIDEKKFLEKAILVKKMLNNFPKSSFVVNSVVIPEKIEELKQTKKAFEDNNIKFYPQLMRVDGELYNYSEEDFCKIQSLIENFLDAKVANVGFSFKNKKCYAGVEYFILNYKGDAHRCYPAKRFEDGYLGNFVKGDFSLWREAKECFYNTCPCTVPINRGMIEL